MLPALSIVVPSQKRSDLLDICLESVCAHAPTGAEIVVVDDGSPDASATRIAQRHGVGSLRFPRSKGFCAAANAGIRASRGDVVQLLNDDTAVTQRFAEAALSRFTDARVGAVASLVLRWPGDRIDSAGDR